MPSIKSDLTNKNISGGGFKQLEVPDESEPMYDYSQDYGPRPNSEDLDINAINARLASRGLPPLDQSGVRAVEARNNQTQNRALQTDALKEFEAKVAEERRLKASGKERLSESAKRRIEMLCDMFNNTKEVDIEGNKFVLSTLSGKEIQDAVIAASEYDGTVSLSFESRKQLLSRSLVKVADTDIGIFLGDNSLEVRLEFLQKLPDPVLSRLYASYVELVSETNKKYGLNTEAAAKEVASDLKK